jgi:hypothetical protein
MIDDGDFGAIGGMKIGSGNRSTRRSAPSPLCPSQIPYDQTWARTRAAVVGSQRLTAWATAQPIYHPTILATESVVKHSLPSESVCPYVIDQELLYGFSSLPCSEGSLKCIAPFQFWAEIGPSSGQLTWKPTDVSRVSTGKKNFRKNFAERNETHVLCPVHSFCKYCGFRDN